HATCRALTPWVSHPILVVAMAQPKSRASKRPPASRSDSVPPPPIAGPDAIDLDAAQADGERVSRPSVIPGAAGSILITGIVGRLGKHLCRVLHRDHPVVGIDRRDFP